MNKDLQLMEMVLKEEKVLQFKEFTNETAWELGKLMVETARLGNKPITIDICKGEQQLFHFAMPGTAPDNDEWIKRKNRLVRRFLHSSFYMGLNYKSSGKSIEESSLLSEKEYAPHGGSFPLFIENVGLVGTITVSGLPQREDHEFVVGVLKKYLQQTV